MMTTEKLYRLGEAAKLLQLDRQTLSSAIKAGKVRYVPTMGGQRRIPASEIERLLEFRREPVKEGGST